MSNPTSNVGRDKRPQYDELADARVRGDPTTGFIFCPRCGYIVLGGRTNAICPQCGHRSCASCSE